jgi:hypothetical protein
MIDMRRRLSKNVTYYRKDMAISLPYLHHSKYDVKDMI